LEIVEAWLPNFPVVLDQLLEHGAEFADDHGARLPGKLAVAPVYKSQPVGKPNSISSKFWK
jgi:hypothetical protein